MRNCNAQNRMNPVCPNESVRDMSPEFVVAMAYVPWQQFGPLYDIEKGLMAVSYTHLDVYKRQALSHINWNTLFAEGKR